MKKLISLTFIFLFLFTSANFISAQTSPVEFYLKCPDNVSKGEEFNVGLYVNPNGNKINALQVVVDYSQGKDHLQTDLSKVKIVSPFFDLPEAKKIEGYRIKIVAGTTQDISSSSDVLLAIIKFTSLGTNPSELIKIDTENTTAAGIDESGNPVSSPTSVGNTQTGFVKAVAVENPLGTESLTDLLENIYNYVVDFIIVIASIVIVWAGYLFLSSGGDKEKIEKAKRLLTWAVIGLVVCILAKGIALVIKNILVEG